MQYIIISSDQIKASSLKAFSMFSSNISFEYNLYIIIVQSRKSPKPCCTLESLRSFQKSKSPTFRKVKAQKDSRVIILRQGPVFLSLSLSVSFSLSPAHTRACTHTHNLAQEILMTQLLQTWVISQKEKTNNF